jgi:hypothetical protein
VNPTINDCVCGVAPSNKDVGIEVQGVYDGILIWQCGTCKRDRPRFVEGKLHSVALEILAEWAKV